MGLMMHLSEWVIPAFNRTDNEEQPLPTTPKASATDGSTADKISCQLKFSTRHRRRMGWAKFKLNR